MRDLAHILRRIEHLENCFLNLSQAAAERTYGVETVKSAEMSISDMEKADPGLTNEVRAQRDPWDYLCRRYIERRSTLS